MIPKDFESTRDMSKTYSGGIGKGSDAIPPRGPVVDPTLVIEARFGSLSPSQPNHVGEIIPQRSEPIGRPAIDGRVGQRETPQVVYTGTGETPGQVARTEVPLKHADVLVPETTRESKKDKLQPPRDSSSETKATSDMPSDTDTKHALTEEEFFERFQGMSRELHGITLRIAGNPHDADDLVQETFIRGWRSRTTFTSDSNFQGWLYRIAANTQIDFYRKQSRNPGSVTRDGTLPEEVASISNAPDDLTHAVQVRDAMIDAGVAPDFANAVVLVDVAGLSYDEAAEVTKAKLGTLRTRVFRGRGKFRDVINAHGTQESDSDISNQREPNNAKLIEPKDPSPEKTREPHVPKIWLTTEQKQGIIDDYLSVDDAGRPMFKVTEIAAKYGIDRKTVQRSVHGIGTRTWGMPSSPDGAETSTTDEETTALMHLRQVTSEHPTVRDRAPLHPAVREARTAVELLLLRDGRRSVAEVAQLMELPGGAVGRDLKLLRAEHSIDSKVKIVAPATETHLPLTSRREDMGDK